MDYKVNLPEGESGTWKVERFEVSESDAQIHNIRAAFNPAGGGIKPGTYTQLTRNGTVVMSDTPSEIQDHLRFIDRAKGRVLITGLGLGEVTHVTVIEKSPDVIRLVAPTLLERFGGRLEIIEADAYTWKPPKGARWDYAWHDVWDNICTDNLPLMAKMHRHYGRRCGFQDSWRKGTLKRIRREEKKEERRRSFWGF